MLTADALTASADATHEVLGGPGWWLLALPVDHIAGVQVLVRSLRAGTPPVAMEVASGFRAVSYTHLDVYKRQSATRPRSLLLRPAEQSA